MRLTSDASSDPRARRRRSSHLAVVWVRGPHEGPLIHWQAARRGVCGRHDHVAAALQRLQLPGRHVECALNAAALQQKACMLRARCTAAPCSVLQWSAVSPRLIAAAQFFREQGGHRQWRGMLRTVGADTYVQCAVCSWARTLMSGDAAPSASSAVHTPPCMQQSRMARVAASHAKTPPTFLANTPPEQHALPSGRWAFAARLCCTSSDGKHTLTAHGNAMPTVHAQLVCFYRASPPDTVTADVPLASRPAPLLPLTLQSCSTSRADCIATAPSSAHLVMLHLHCARSTYLWRSSAVGTQCVLCPKLYCACGKKHISGHTLVAVRALTPAARCASSAWPSHRRHRSPRCGTTAALAARHRSSGRLPFCPVAASGPCSPVGWAPHEHVHTFTVAVLSHFAKNIVGHMTR